MFYEQFIKLCNENGTRPSTVAEEIGLNKSSATAWEKGATPVSCYRNKIPVSTTDTGIFLVFMRVCSDFKANNIAKFI